MSKPRPKLRSAPKSAGVQRSAWVNSRRLFLQKIQGEVERRLGPEPLDIREARRALLRELHRPFKNSSKSELVSAIELADVVYGGDFHAYAQAQRTHLRILRSLGNDRPTILALEAFSIKHQKWIDLYLAGAISAQELRSKSHWDQEWGFPWSHYEPLLDFARKSKLRILALRDSKRIDQQEGLLARDRFAASLIAQAYRKNPGSLIYTVFGDLHLHSKALPREVELALYGERKKSSLRSLVIHLNPENVYFSLAKNGDELSVDVVKYSNQVFGVLSSPPWVPWQNYLLYLDYQEGRADSFDEDLDRQSSEPDEFRLAAPEATDHVARFALLLMDDLDVEFGLDSFSVHPTGDSEIAAQASRNLSAKKLQIAKHLLSTGRSFVLAETKTAHLASAAVNHAAHVAGIFVHLGLAKYRSTPWDFPNDFQRAIWCEALAFCLSKYINHKRRSLTLTDLRAQMIMDVGQAEAAREALKLALDSRMSEVLLIHQKRHRRAQFRPRQKSSYIEAARILGAMMGERLFLALRAGKVKKEELRKWLSRPLQDDFSEFYTQTVLRLGSQFDSKFKSKRERI